MNLANKLVGGSDDWGFAFMLYLFSKMWEVDRESNFLVFEVFFSPMPLDQLKNIYFVPPGREGTSLRAALVSFCASSLLPTCGWRCEAV